ncbi:MAG: PAS domain S-box protein [Geothrix sp.]|nr:PAS domain S-box protein [Geothrix sp.]
MTAPRRSNAPIPLQPIRPEEELLAARRSGDLFRSFLVVCAIIVLTESTIMVLLEPLFPEDRWTLVFVEAGTLILVCFPSIYFLLIKPMARNLFEKAEAERALKEMQATNEFLLQDAEDRIRTEALERTKADARIQFQARILAVVQQAVVATGKGGVILYWNRFAEWMFGWTEEEVRDQTLAKVTGFTLEAARSGLSGFGAVKGWNGEVKAVRRDGSSFPAYLTCSPIWRTDGSVAGFVYTFIDITDRKSAEVAIRDSEEKYSTVVENSPTGIFIYRNGRLEFGNQRFFQMVGRSQSDLARMDVAEIIHSDDWPEVRELWRRRLAGLGATQDYECRILHSGGETRWISGRTALIRYGGASALLGNIQDITERRKAEQALRDSRETLHRLSARLMSAQENERQRVARELHDSIGQSLSAVKFIVERAIDEQGASGGDEQGRTLRTVVPVIQGAVEEVRRISMALRPTTLDDLGLLATIAWFTREFQATYPHMDVERLIEVEEFEVPEILKTNIFRILQEAMNNAAKYSQAARITVALRQVLGDLHLVVADDGIGFLPGEARRNASGGGFGLVSMRERAELFEGSLILTSSPGEGTMIIARWPLPEEAIS